MLPADTNIIQLCAQGMNGKGKGEAHEARLFFRQAGPKAAPVVGPGKWQLAQHYAAAHASTGSAAAGYQQVTKTGVATSLHRLAAKI